ncbi:TPA: prepilin-type N-terminal cleavage/methylation domain-containing protein [Citrobacter freundii]|nr:prepilin-type N-terminal cleavage/methylation domain-containing protein [Citrobacter freundii]
MNKQRGFTLIELMVVS